MDVLYDLFSINVMMIHKKIISRIEWKISIIIVFFIHITDSDLFKALEVCIYLKRDTLKAWIYFAFNCKPYKMTQ